MTIAAAETIQNAHDRLREQIAAVIGVPPAALSPSRQRPWASMSFRGTRHEFLLARETPLSCETSAHLLRCHEFALEGEIVADTSFAPEDGGYRVEALTVAAK